MSKPSFGTFLQVQSLEARECLSAVPLADAIVTHAPPSDLVATSATVAGVTNLRAFPPDPCLTGSTNARGVIDPNELTGGTGATDPGAVATTPTYDLKLAKKV